MCTDCRFSAKWNPAPCYLSSLLVLLSNPNVVPCHIWIDLKFLLSCNGVSRLAIFDPTLHNLTTKLSVKATLQVSSPLSGSPLARPACERSGNRYAITMWSAVGFCTSEFCLSHHTSMSRRPNSWAITLLHSMSTTDFPDYAPSSAFQLRSPSYTSSQQYRLPLNTRLGPDRTSCEFFKGTRNGCVSLRLSGQDGQAPLPDYGQGASVQGTVDIHKVEGITSVEVQVLFWWSNH